MAASRSTVHLLTLVAVTIIVYLAETAYTKDTFHHPECQMKHGGTFPDLIRCIRRRNRRQVFDPYDHWGNPRDRPCVHFVPINQPERRVGNVIDKLTDNALCDRALKRRWYRFDSEAGGMMPESCIEEFSCGTHAPIWLNGRHPANEGDVMDMEVCLSLAGHCCNRRWRIRVANCGKFFTYLLVDTPGCFMAYCVGDKLPCPPGTSSPTGFTPGCSRDFPQLPGQVKLTVDREGHQVIIYCDYEGRIPGGVAIDVDWYVTGDKDAGPGEADEYPVWTDRMIERRRSKLVEGRWIGKMGSTIYCKMKAMWKNNTGVPGPALTSRKFFAGIEVLERVVMVNEAADEAIISLRSTVPINCLPQFDEACSLSLQVAHDQRYTTKRCVDGKVRQVVFGDCTIEITPENWNDIHQVKVKAVRDFYYDGNKRMKVNFKPTFSTLLSDIWNNYKVPDIDVVAEDAPTKLCYSTGDPHYVTFDGLYYHVYLEGEFVMYKNTRLPIQINTRMEKCGTTVTCNCAVAVKAADDVIVIDRCMRRKRNLAYGESFPDGWKTLHRHALEQGEEFTEGLNIYEYDEGKRFTVHLPTGAYIDFKVGEKWIDVYMYASSDDYMSSAGLCGTFDGDQQNDFTFRDMVTRSTPQEGAACGDSEDVCKFAESWRVPKKESFFGPVVEVPLEDARFHVDQQYCKCEEHGRSSTIVCNYHYDVDNCQARETQRKGHHSTQELLRRSRSKRSVDLDDEDDDYFQSEFDFDENFKGQEPTWPTPSGITESEARSYCEDVIENSEAGAICATRVLDLPKLIDACMTDIKVTDDKSWALSALTSLTEDCVRSVHNEARLWEEPALDDDDVTDTEAANQTTRRPQTTTAPPSPTYGQRLLRRVCPSGCSMNGRCEEGACVCRPGYTGSDCSVSTAKRPQIFHLSSGGLCDTTKKACRLVRVYGTNFRNSSSLTCHLQELNLSEAGEATASGNIVKVPAHFDTFEEIICPVRTEASVHSDSFYRALEVSVSNDDSHVTEPQVFIIHDSRCRSCSVNGRSSRCSTRMDSCEIGGLCYAAQEHNPADCCYVCDPTVSRHSFGRATALDPPKITPEETTYVVQAGERWQLEVHAEDKCLTFLEVNEHPMVEVVRDGQDAFSLLVTAATIGQYTADVMAKDGCGATSRKTYRLIVVNEMTSHSGQRSPEECEDNKPPSFSVYPEDSLKVQVVTGEVLTLRLQGEDPEGRPLEYNLVTTTSDQRDGLSLSRDGELTIRASEQTGDQNLGVVALDDCQGHAFLTLHVTKRQCDCQNGGQCVSLGGKPWKRRLYHCDCPSSYTGRKCQRRRRVRRAAGSAVNHR